MHADKIVPLFHSHNMVVGAFNKKKKILEKHWVPPKHLYWQREKFSCQHCHQSAFCTPQALTTFPVTGKLTTISRDNERPPWPLEELDWVISWEKGQLVFEPFHPRKAVWFFSVFLMMVTIITIVSFTLYPCLDELQGKEPTAEEPMKEKSQGLSFISLPIVVTCTPGQACQTDPGRVCCWAAPKYQRSPKPSLHKVFA